jgi:hypothetical protein
MGGGVVFGQPSRVGVYRSLISLGGWNAVTSIYHLTYVRHSLCVGGDGVVCV